MPSFSLLLRLQLAQIIDDREDAVPHRLLGSAGKIEKGIESLSRLLIADTTLFGILRCFLLSVVGAGTAGNSWRQPQIGISAPR